MNNEVVVRANKRFKTILQAHQLFEAPQQLKPESVLPSEWNRTPNMAYVHFDIGPKMGTDGFFPNRAQPGMVISRRSPEAVARLVGHSQALMRGNDLYPPLFPDLARYECIGGQHLSLTLRLFNAEIPSSLSGFKWKANEDDEDLDDRRRKGHYYVVLDEQVSEADAIFLSEYLNVGQNRDCGFSDVMLLENTQKMCKEEFDRAKFVRPSSIVAKIQSQTAIKIKVDNVGDVARYVCNQGITTYIDELIKHISVKVNPKELQVAPAWFGEVARAFGKEYPLVVLNTTFVHYDGDTVNEQSRSVKIERDRIETKRGIA